MVWGGADVLRRLLDAAKWPFERIIWAIERGLVWPLEERTGDWSAPVRAFGVIALALLAVGAGVLGLVWASGSGGGGSAHLRTATPVAAPIVQQTPVAEPDPAAPVLQGAKPDFTVESGGGVSQSSAEVAPSTGADAAANSTSEVASSGATSSNGSSGAPATEVAGPAAIKVAHQFAGAFVLYETGRETAKIRDAFAETATPQLTHSLLGRPPRLPAGVKVPKAKVLNVVAGPHHGDTYTLSVSLLRLGVASELRLDMQPDPKTSQWRVTDVRG
ncbi:MAG: hypothetical protein QOF13_2319 [Solirubrobacterales bacterium]|nr:hypothetical protein [Solirubrobacterales bacterium]